MPENILEEILKLAGKRSSPVRVKGFINNAPFEQTLVRYNRAWRLYINTKMLRNSPQRIGEQIKVRITYNAAPKKQQEHEQFSRVLKQNKKAQKVFDQFPPSLQNEIIRYIANLKSETAVKRNIEKAIDFLLGKGRFVGRQLK